MTNRTWSSILLIFSIVIFLDSISSGDSGRQINTLDLNRVQTPSIQFTHVPPYETSEELIGRVHNVKPGDFKVAAYIFIEGAGWWTKPTFANPLTTINSDCTWSTNIATGGNDIYATRIRAFLVPKNANPEASAGLACLPTSLNTLAVASTMAERNSGLIAFSNYEWWIKSSGSTVGPGPNFFSDSRQNVWVDGNDRLHVKITNRDNKWYCPEVILKDTLGYGTYTFKLEGDIGALDENIVFGLFTWDNDACSDHFREIDIEFSRWGDANGLNAQYVIQPWNRAGNRRQWMLPTSLKKSIHSFHWTPDSIVFSSLNGDSSAATDDLILHAWTYKGTYVPETLYENLRINLWLFNGLEPANQAEAEVIISHFEFIPETNSVTSPQQVEIHEYSLSQNYPNPFNPITKLNFTLPSKSNVRIEIYNMLGIRVQTLIDEEFPAGEFKVFWDGRDNTQSLLPSGIYVARMRAGNFTSSKKLTLLR